MSLADTVETAKLSGKLVFAVLGAMKEVEADANRERTGESFLAAEATGRRWGGPLTFEGPEDIWAASLAGGSQRPADPDRHASWKELLRP